MEWKSTTEKNPKVDAPMGGWWEYSQNNSGGSFDPDGGMSTWIWAHSAKQADDIAEQNGIYFDGCQEGLDCPCCGDRWYSARGGKPDMDDVPVDVLVKHLTTETNYRTSALAYATSWNLGIRIIDKDGATHWLKAKK